ncbi:hypothetical protein ACFP3Q_14050 [Nocardioides sp. GCM10027113]|uniref:hypothetical protein n=1 Tax=unclassified Nocardioides TaxID=2615069 RepID=UPI00361101AF
MLLRRTVALVAAGLLLGALVTPVAGAPAAVPPDPGAPVVSDFPRRGTPHAMDGTVLDVVEVGDLVVVAGTFRRVSPGGTFHDPSDDLDRYGIFAFDADTGEIDPQFAPRLNGSAYALATDGRSVHVGGAFSGVAGQTRYARLVRLSLDGKVMSSFRASPDLPVTDLAVDGKRLYVAGAFQRIRTDFGRPSRGALAALRTETGKVLDAVDLRFRGYYDPHRSNRGRTNVRRFDVSADGDRLVAIGNFARVDGKKRSQVVVLDTSRYRARVTRWRTVRFDRHHSVCGSAVSSPVRGVALSPDDRWFVVTTAGGWGGGSRTGSLCDTASAWTTKGRGRQPRWVAYTGADTVLGVAVTEAAVYVGGHFRWFNNPFRRAKPGPGAVPRQGIAALDPRNGLPLSWNPGKQRGIGAEAVVATGRGLWVGSDTTLFAAQRRGRIAWLPWEGGSTVPEVGRAVLPNDLFVARHELLRRPVGADGVPTGDPVPVGSPTDWSSVRGAALVDGELYLGRSDGTLEARTFDPASGALGPPEQIDLRPGIDGRRLPFPVEDITGMFFDPSRHRLYYTLRGDRRLFFRGFTPESRVVGAETHQAARDGLDLRKVRGMTLAGDRVLYGAKDGTLRSARFVGGGLSGEPRVLSDDGSWRAKGLFVPTD